MTFRPYAPYLVLYHVPIQYPVVVLFHVPCLSAEQVTMELVEFHVLFDCHSMVNVLLVMLWKALTESLFKILTFRQCDIKFLDKLPDLVCSDLNLNP